MNKKDVIKCFWCKGKSKKGMHDICWKEFKGFMLSDKVAVDRPSERTISLDDFQPTGQSFKDQAGRIVSNGRVGISPTD